jgi:hypothetical protein
MRWRHLSILMSFQPAMFIFITSVVIKCADGYYLIFLLLSCIFVFIYLVLICDMLQFLVTWCSS